MFAAIVRNSSESVGDSETICWNCAITLRTSASNSDEGAGATSSSVSTSATMKGSDWTKRTSRTRLTPSVNTNRLWLGMRTTLCTVARVPTVCRSSGLGVSRRGSNCAATTIVRSSPSDSINWIELSRPTVSGRTAWGNRTVSRTGNTGILRIPGAFACGDSSGGTALLIWH